MDEKTIRLSKATHKKLVLIKIENDYKSMDELINELIKSIQTR